MADSPMQAAIVATGLAPREIAGVVIVGTEPAGLALPRLVLAPEATDVGARVMRWCIEHRLDPSRVAWWSDTPAAPAAAAVQDVLWYHGVDTLGAAPSELVRAWADHVFACERLLTALVAYLWLERIDASPSLATRIAITWARLGAPARAHAWLAKGDVPASRRAAAQADLVAAATDARVQAEQLLADNLAHLAEHWPDAARAIAAASTDDIELVWCADVPWRLRILGERFTVERAEHPLLLRRVDDRWSPARMPEPPLVLRAQIDPRTPLPALHACIGAVADHVGLVNVLSNRVVSKLPNWSQQVEAVETDAALLRKLAESTELAALLRPDLLASLRVGPDAERELVADFAAHPHRPLPRVRSSWSPALAEGFAALEGTREQARERNLVELPRRYDAGFATRVLAKLEAGQPLRVWGWSSLHTTVLQHVARSLAEGFRALGHEVELLIEQQARERIGPADCLASLAAFEPDVAVLLDHVRPEYGPLLPPGLPVIGWILDELPGLSDPRVLARLGPLDLAFAWSEPLTQMYRGLGYPHCEALPFAVDTDTYRADPNATVEPVVAYATHVIFPDDLACAPGLFRALEARMFAMEHVEAGVEPLRPLLDATIAELGLRIPAERYGDLAYQCMMIARHVDRVKVADAVLSAGLPIAVYGRGWDAIPRFAAHHRGLLAPGPELRAMYQRSAVVLHINTRCNLHPRVLECAASGGFVLARSDGDYDFAPGGVDGCMRVGTELCLFDDTADMIAKIRRAFDDPAWRAGFVQAGHDRVHAEHGYRARAAAMLDGLHRRLTKLLRRAA